MRNEIQDSDDDGDLESPIQHKARLGDELKLPSAQHGSIRSANGTSSTELLRRGMQEAKDALFASNNAFKRPLGSDQAPMPSSPAAQRAKRRKTTADVRTEPASSSQKLERRKTAKTYGQTRSSGQPRSEIGSSAFEALKGLDEDVAPSNDCTRRESEYISAQENLPAANAAISENPVWDLPPTMMQNFLEHEPVAMFPSNEMPSNEPSSTVPEDTMVQQQLLNEAVFTTMANGIGELPTAHPDSTSSSSLHWSALQSEKSPSGTKTADNPPDQPKSSARVNERRSDIGSPKRLLDSDSGKMAPPPLANGTPQRRGVRSTTPQVSPPSHQLGTPKRNMQSNTPRGTPPTRSSERLRRTKTYNDATHSSQEQKASFDKFQVENPKTTSKVEKTASAIETYSKHEQIALEREENSLSIKQASLSTKGPEVHETTSPIKPNNLSKQPAPDMDEDGSSNQSNSKRKRTESLKKSKEITAAPSSDPLGSDDLAAIGLPRERYKPRASRSRSTQLISMDDIDFSKVPERTAKAKRRKTVDLATVAEAPPESPDKSKVSMVSDMGFTPARAKKALKESHGNLEGALDSLITGVATNKDSSGAAVIAVEQHGGVAILRRTDEEVVEPHDTDEPASEVVAGKKVLESVTVLVKPNVTVAEEAIELKPTTASTFATEDVVKPAKKGRGRPKRAAKKGELPEDSHVEDLPPAPPEIQERDPSPKETTTSNANEDPEDSPPKKRGRGRPRSIQQAEATKLEAHHDSVEATTTATHSSNTARTKRSFDHGALAEVDVNAKMSEAARESAVEPKAVPPPSTPEQAQKDAPPVTPTSKPDQTVARSTSSTSANATNAPQHSPINKSKVPLRVGLSRRARIQPLLRTLKK